MTARYESGFERPYTYVQLMKKRLVPRSMMQDRDKKNEHARSITQLEPRNPRLSQRKSKQAPLHPHSNPKESERASAVGDGGKGKLGGCILATWRSCQDQNDVKNSVYQRRWNGDPDGDPGGREQSHTEDGNWEKAHSRARVKYYS